MSTLKKQQKCAKTLIRKSGPLHGKKPGNCMWKGVNRSVYLHALWHVQFLSNDSEETGQEEDLSTKGTE